MTHALGIAGALALPLLLGRGLLRWADVRADDDRLAWCAWWLAASALGTALLSALWLTLGGESQRGVQLFVAATALVVHALARRRPARRRPARPDDTARAHVAPAPRTAPAIERALFGLALLAVLVTALAHVADAHATALVDGDDAAFWAPKAKLIYLSADDAQPLAPLVDALEFPPGYWDALAQRTELATERGAPTPEGVDHLTQTAHRVGHLDYPLVNPLLQWWCFVGAGRVLDGAQRLPLQLLAVALLLLLASALRAVVRPGLAAVLLLLVAWLPTTRVALTSAYADGMVALGLLLACDALRRAPRLPPRAWCALTTLGLTLLVGAKHEGTALALLLLAVTALNDRARLRALLPWLALPVTLRLATWGFNTLHGFENDLVAGSTLRLERLPEVLGFFWREVWWVPWQVGRTAHLNLNGLLLLALLGWLLDARRDHATWAGLCGGLLLLANVMLVGVYLSTPHDLAWQLPTSARRVAWQLVPLAALALAERLGRIRATAAA